MNLDVGTIIQIEQADQIWNERDEYRNSQILQYKNISDFLMDDFELIKFKVNDRLFGIDLVLY